MRAMSSRTGIAGPLLRWYARRGRDLPWRRDPNPYRVWVSEVMLQQTTVATTIPYYERFMRRYPTVRSLARAREEDLLAAWSGLGYYRRARNLLESARIICRDHGGKIPRTPDELRALPGVGAYTAGAILSIGHHLPYTAIDGNIQRVIARLGALRGDPSRAPVRRAIADLVSRAMPAKRASDFNQALMDLGAMVCTPREPRCGQCAIEKSCEASRLGLVESIPSKPRTERTLPVEMVTVAVKRGGKCLLVMRDDGPIMRGMWEFPLAGLSHHEDAADLAGRMGACLGRAVGDVRHTITHHRMKITVYEARPIARRSQTPTSRRRKKQQEVGSLSVAEPHARLTTTTGAPVTRWCALEDIVNGQGLPITGTARKIARLLLGRQSGTASTASTPRARPALPARPR